MVCTSQPLAAAAGLDILKQGGNAIDAAIATAACMPVLEPTSNGLGSDSFALVWTGGRLYGLNASGNAPALLSAQALREAGHTSMPRFGWGAVTVPGAVSAWASLSERFGRLPFESLLAPAISYAEEGYPVSPITAHLWGRTFRDFSEKLTDDAYREWFRVFAPGGHAPQPGEIWRSPDHAATLRELAATRCESFYRGALAERIDAFSRSTGGYLRAEDLAAYHNEWVDPISTNYRGYDVWEIPPNGHGIVALMALNILEGFTFRGRDDTETFHRQLEAMKLAFADGQRYVTDPRDMRVTAGQLLSKEYAAKRRQLIGDSARAPEAGDPASGGTIYLCTADAEGNMVSYIQSNYVGFGSGLVVPGTGIALHNRGYNFSLDETSDNCVAPGKKPYHTIIPGFLSRDGKPVGPFGVMGGFMQPQGHVQMVMNTVDFGMNPQEALDAPRWQWVGGMDIEVERDFPAAQTEELVRKGHHMRVPTDSYAFGRGQIIWRGEDGVLMGATEPRADGAVAAW
ncbi:gamma-glutamyltransferase family protein [Clostridiales bacterium BX7]|uniref:Gamma-glutamyltransferase family protein n=2 Tax=Feifania hominis TaxID=2763660 RepID=A0A926DCE7_9FIRM|nr:gamma-glutamyltransferase family protein [Feifania hominis]